MKLTFNDITGEICFFIMLNPIMFKDNKIFNKTKIYKKEKYGS